MLSHLPFRSRSQYNGLSLSGGGSAMIFHAGTSAVKSSDHASHSGWSEACPPLFTSKSSVALMAPPLLFRERSLRSLDRYATGRATSMGRLPFCQSPPSCAAPPANGYHVFAVSPANQLPARM